MEVYQRNNNNNNSVPKLIEKLKSKLVKLKQEVIYIYPEYNDSKHCRNFTNNEYITEGDNLTNKIIILESELLKFESNPGLKYDKLILGLEELDHELLKFKNFTEIQCPDMSAARKCDSIFGITGTKLISVSATAASIGISSVGALVVGASSLLFSPLGLFAGAATLFAGIEFIRGFIKELIRKFIEKLKKNLEELKRELVIRYISSLISKFLKVFIFLPESLTDEKNISEIIRKFDWIGRLIREEGIIKGLKEILRLLAEKIKKRIIILPVILSFFFI